MNSPRIVPAPGTSQFIRDYAAGADAIAPFYTGHPYDLSAYARKADEVRTRLAPEARTRIASAYRPLNEEAARKLKSVLAGDGFCVTTGQQAGLFTGPLYTVYKALSAVRLAAELERALDVTVLPVFWVAADDHDWAEVDHVRVLDGQDYVREVRVRSEHELPPWPMSRRTLGRGIERAIEELEALMPQDGFGADVRAMVRRTYTPERTVAAAFEDMMADILAPYPIAIVSSADPAIKRASLPYALHELAHTLEHGQLIARQTARFEQAGYKAQVDVTPDASNVFLLRDTGRDRLVRGRDEWVLRRTGERIADEALLQLAANDPGILSANVFLRPVLESALIPTLSYVGGPAETAYFAQIGCLFEAHGIMPPVVFPRHNLTIVEPRAASTLTKFGYDLDAVRRPFEDVVARLIDAEMPTEVTSAIIELEKGIEGGYRAVAASLPAVDPTLAGPVRRHHHRMVLEVRRMKKRIQRQYRSRNAARIETLRRAASSIHPTGSPQERVLNITPYLARYGPDIVRNMADAMSVALDRTMPLWSGVKCDGNDGTASNA